MARRGRGPKRSPIDGKRLVNGKQHHRQKGPAEPRPQAEPTGKPVGGLGIEACARGPVWSVDIDLDGPAARPRQFERGRVKKLVRRGAACRGVLSRVRRPLAGSDTQIDFHVGQRVARRGILDKHADFDAAGSKRIRRGESADAIIALRFRKANRSTVGPRRGWTARGNQARGQTNARQTVQRTLAVRCATMRHG